MPRQLQTIPREVARVADIKTFREMAASFRRLAAASRRPECLLMRAEHYDGIAAELDRPKGR